MWSYAASADGAMFDAASPVPCALQSMDDIILSLYAPNAAGSSQSH